MAGSVGASLLLQLGLLVSGVLTARLLGVEGRGYLVLLMLVPLALSPLATLGLPLAVVFEVSRVPLAARAIARSVARPAVAQTVALVLVHAGALVVLLQDAPEEVQRAGAVSVAVGPAILGQHYALAILQGQGNFRAFNVLRLLPFLLNSLLVAAVFVFGLDDLALLALVWTATYAAAAVTTAVWARHALPREGESSPGPPLRTMIRFGSKALLGSASPVETFRIDQAVVGLFLSPAALGLYAAGLAFTNLPRLVALGVGAVAFPDVAARTEPAAARRAMWRFVVLTLAASSILVLGLGAVAGWLVPFFFGASFEGAVPLTQILLVGAPFIAARRVLTDASRGTGLAGIGSVGELASWIVLLPSVALGASVAGVTGVAAGLTVSAVVSALLLAAGVFLAQRRTVAGEVAANGIAPTTPAGVPTPQPAREPGPV